MAKLRKVQVTTGVSWVEAPDCGLQVLCGCPADVVKHLRHRGLIGEVERDGVTFESGPNAILLSDVMLQNGAFCNMAEFPVLQMLYRQGMLLPGHPSNSGAKPLLIGHREQLEAQLLYIHRGNYGLVKREELLAAGASASLADELLALKNRYAFGHIRHPRELLDTVPLGERPVMLKGGVQLARTGLNRFEFRLGEETVAVDLNLPSGRTYEPPYTLGAHRIDREYFAVVHAGEGDGWDADRPSTGSVLMFQGRVYLIDAGPHVEYALNALGIGVNEIEGVFHTHCHDDHFAGLTTLLRGDRRVKYFATPLVRASVMKKLAALLAVGESTFHDCFDARDLAFDQWNHLGGLEVMPILSPHPVETNIFVFRALWENGYRSYAHFADIASLSVLRPMVATGDMPGISQEFYDKVAADYRMPVDIKKVDIGGGLIHGSAEDFRGDRSGKLVLAHLDRPLSLGEKEIGGSAPFGTMDVLIPGNHDYLWRSAHEFLRSYFPSAPAEELRALLDCPLVTYNPACIVQREGAPVEAVQLVVTGTVETIAAGSPVSGMLSAGGMIGEVAGIEGRLSGKTYRASTFVRALHIDVEVYADFIRRNGLLTEVIGLDARRDFLRSTWLCGEGLGAITLNRLARDMTLQGLEPGQRLEPAGTLALVRAGCAELLAGAEAIETLEPGEVYGEESVLFGRMPLFGLRAVTPAEIYLCPAAALRDVPVLHWKLLERHERRLQAAALATEPRIRAAGGG